MATLSIPNSFSAGNTIVASQVNANFTALVNWSTTINTDNFATLTGQVTWSVSTNVLCASMSNSGTAGALDITYTGTPASGKAAFKVISTTAPAHPFPTQTTAQADAVTNKSAGDGIYNSDTKQLEFYNGTAYVGLGQALGLPLTKTSNYTLTARDGVIAGDTSGGAFTLTLPDCASHPGKRYLIKYTDSGTTNALTIARAGSDTIQDVSTSGTSTTLNTQGEMVEIASFGSTVWQILSRRIPSVNTSYTPTGPWTTNCTYTGMWRRVGDSVDLQISVSVSGGAPGVGGALQFTTTQLFNGLGMSVDTAKFPGFAATDSLWAVGTWTAKQSAVANYGGTAVWEGSGARVFLVKDAGGALTHTDPFSFGTGDRVVINMRIGVTNWKG